MNGWKIATFVLGGLVVAQFLWWNKKAPGVLNLGSGSSGGVEGLPEYRFGNNWSSR